MARLPEKLRLVLERVVRKLSRRETVSGVGLFGSWSRGDADTNSDVDLLVVDGRDFEYEYVDRLECEDFLVDLNYIPKKWVIGSVPPEIDQKLYEMVVLHDREWLLTNTKDWISRTYRKPERVDIRTEVHLVESDIYLSRAASAYSRGDFQSACVFASMGLESMLKILVEVNLLPISNTRFVGFLERSAKKLGCPKFFSTYLAVSRLYRLSHRDTERRVGLFRVAWDDVWSFVKDNASVLDSLHFKVRSKLGYYGKPGFLRGMIARSQEIIHAGMYAEASNYLLRVLVDLLENYAWLASTVEGIKLNYTTLFRSLKGLKETPMEVYETAVEAFNVKDVTQKEAEEVLKLARETALNVRRQRRDLIRGFVGPLG
ncbi:MAG: nucleotidyltransferase family protein [Candidatus Bathyarchaeia archaeon]